jgi:hypothetical protein
MQRRARSARTLVPVLGAALVVTAALPATASPPPGRAGGHPQQQVAVVGIEDFPTTTAGAPFDYAQRARDYDAYVYDWTDRGVYTTISADAANDTFKMPSYYGDARVQPGTTGDGDEEAVNEIASVVGASLVGIDKSSQRCNAPGGTTCNYVDQLRAFYDSDLGVARNTPSAASDAPGSGSIWYTTTANVLYYMLGSLYPHATDMSTMLRSIADHYATMVESQGGDHADLTMRDYDWATNTTVSGRNEGGEAAAGAVAILLWAHSKFGDARYLRAAEGAMNYLESSSKDLFYEVLPELAPYLAARLNAETGSDYDVSKYFSWLMQGSSTRSGWGTVGADAGTWGTDDPKSVAGLVGSRTDSGGYVFAMNSFATPLMAATAKYDARYANTVGRWLLNVEGSARYFYADQMPAAQQYYAGLFTQTPESVIAYEGIMRTGVDGIQARGDIPERSSKWGVGDDARSLGLYGSSWVGFLGSTVTPTNVRDVYRTDLDKLDFFGDNRYPTSLYYNPGTAPAHVLVSLQGRHLLYDAVSDRVLARAARGRTTVTVPAGGSVVLVEGPAGGSVTRAHGRTLVNGIAVGYDTMPSRDVAATASATATGTLRGSSPAAAVDGSERTAWRSRGNATLDLDLGSARRISSVAVRWSARPERATVLTSTDGSTWSTAWTGRPAGSAQAVTFDPTTARFVRLRIDAPSPRRTPGVSTVEVRDADLALGGDVQVSSTQNTVNVASNLTDGSDATRWESKTADPQWASVDLGRARALGSVQVAWETAAAKEYTVAVSDDGTTWRTVATVADGASGETRTIALPAGTAGRYVKVEGTSRTTKYAYSIFRISAYAPAASKAVR